VETEWLKDTIYHTKDKTISDLMKYIKMFYYNQRVHSAVSYKNIN